MARMTDANASETKMNSLEMEWEFFLDILDILIYCPERK